MLSCNFRQIEYVVKGKYLFKIYLCKKNNWMVDGCNFQNRFLLITAFISKENTQLKSST